MRPGHRHGQPDPETRPLGTLRPHLSLLRGQEWPLAGATILMVASTAVSLAIPIYAGRFVDAMADMDAWRAALTDRYLAILVALLVAQLAGTFFYTVLSARLGLRTVTRLRKRIYAHLLELPALFFTGHKAGDLSSRVTSDVGSIQYLLTSGLIALARAVLTLIGALVLMLNLNPRLTVVVLLLIPATIALVRIFGSRLQRLSRRMFDELGRVSSHVQETVAGIRTLKVYNNQNNEAARFGAMVDRYEAAGMKRAWLSAAFESGIQISLWVCLIGIMVYGFALAAQGRTTGGQLVAFLLLAFRVAMPLASLTNLYASAQGAAAAAGRLDDIFALPTERPPGAPVPPPSSAPVGLSLRDVSFRYPGQEEPVLAGIDLDIAPGEWIGLVGASGAGKTTLAGLVMGLYPPSGGTMALAGRPYEQYDLAELRSHMAFVAQDPVIPDLTIRENIRLGTPDAPAEAVLRAAQRAGVLDFAERLPDGWDSACGEGGVRLSGGQKQRISLARAFLRDPGLLVLDEPTSALDAGSERNVQQSLHELMNNRTVIVIAHRFSLVRDLHRIVVLQDGRIRESGRHEELMRAGGLYHHMYGLQSGEENDLQ